jgi:hypothetical protein
MRSFVALMNEAERAEAQRRKTGNVRSGANKGVLEEWRRMGLQESESCSGQSSEQLIAGTLSTFGDSRPSVKQNVFNVSEF